MRAMIGVFLAALGIVSAGEKSGHAEAELLLSNSGYQPGEMVELAIRLKLDEGWHTYWINPGEGGMALSVKWELPEGWSAGPLMHPVPQRFMTGDLPGYGYEEEVVFPVRLQPGESASGPVTVTAKLDWLTCDDSACVPGSAEISATLAEGKGDVRDAERIAEVMKKVPRDREGASLEVEVAAKTVRLAVTLPEGVDPAGCEVFPATPGVLDHSEPIRLERAGEGWTASVPLNEYAAGPPERLEIVLAGGALAGPLRLEWSRATD